MNERCGVGVERIASEIPHHAAVHDEHDIVPKEQWVDGADGGGDVHGDVSLGLSGGREADRGEEQDECDKNAPTDGEGVLEAERVCEGNDGSLSGPENVVHGTPPFLLAAMTFEKERP